MVTELIGTLYPLMLDALTSEKISVGSPYFNQVLIPITVLLFIGMGIAIMSLSEAAIDTGVFCDLYIALGEPLENNAWGIRLYYKPFVRWIWSGGF